MVNDSIDNLRLDINKPKVKASISVRKGDTKTRTIHIALTSNGAVYSLENVLMAEMLIVKPDGKVCDQDMVIKGNELQYTFRTQDTNVVGTCVCQIRLTFTDGAYLTSPEFYMYVYNMILSQDTSKSENEYSQTDALLSKANEYYENAKNLAETVEANLNDAIDARDGAEVAAEAAALSEANAAASAEEAKITIRPATPTEVGTVKPDGTTITVDLDGTIHATGNTSPIATTTTAGIVIPDGTTITVDADGTIHGANDTPIATTEEVGTVKPDGTTITIDLDGTIHGASTTPIATTEDVGSVKPDGVTITIDEDGVIKATGNTSPIATISTAGIVIPDGTSITVDVDGTIHATETQIATTEDAGSVKPDGVTITVDEDGVIKATGNTSPIATTTTAGIVIPDGTTITVDADGTIHGANDTPIATTEEVGSVKPDGTTITVDLDGTLHATGNTSPIATTTTAGIVIPDGTTITVDVDGTIHATNDTPIATSTEVGTVKPDGTTITVDGDGTIHATETPVATTTLAGIVKPDGSTITVDPNGTIHAESIIDDTSKATNTTYSSNKIETNYPFRFGIDADGNYGYYKDGADSVTPFKSGDEFLSVAPFFSPTETYTHDSVVFKNDTDEDLYQYTGDAEEFSGAWDDSKWTKVMIPEISKSSSGEVKNPLYFLFGTSSGKYFAKTFFDEFIFTSNSTGSSTCYDDDNFKLSYVVNSGYSNSHWSLTAKTDLKLKGTYLSSNIDEVLNKNDSKTFNITSSGTMNIYITI